MMEEAKVLGLFDSFLDGKLKMPYKHFTSSPYLAVYNIRKKICSDKMANQKFIWLAICRIAWSCKLGGDLMVQCEAQAL